MVITTISKVIVFSCSFSSSGNKNIIMRAKVTLQSLRFHFIRPFGDTAKSQSNAAIAGKTITVWLLNY